MDSIIELIEDQNWPMLFEKYLFIHHKIMD